ncbi:hypothetical protein EB796_008300 [Bugula neritina]|uniref:Protein sleepless n=1 Tax=Bugula neritina TaxID=10212 RepID=A0A7J7K703_BUGNE|nr:hypothetical protein EB796_008300 [Bugula neritina]
MNKAIVLLVILGSVSVTHGLKCYQCQSDDLDSDCQDDYTRPSAHLKPCVSGIADGCSKSKIRTKLLGSKVITVRRSCGTQYGNTECQNKDRSIGRLNGERVHMANILLSYVLVVLAKHLTI